MAQERWTGFRPARKQENDADGQKNGSCAVHDVNLDAKSLSRSHFRVERTALAHGTTATGEVSQGRARGSKLPLL
jgi:hypothetical protein